MAAEKPDLSLEIGVRNRGKLDRPGQDIRWLLSEIRQLRREMKVVEAMLDYEQRSLWTRFKAFFAGGV